MLQRKFTTTQATRVKILELYRPEFKSHLASSVTYAGFLTSLGYRDGDNKNLPQGVVEGVNEIIQPKHLALCLGV